MTKKKVIVVIPVHQETPAELELQSLRQCSIVFKGREITILGPKGMDFYQYTHVAPDINIMSIDPVWFSSIKMYNELKKSRFFYGLFSDYEFLLTYELDAWVFKDELDFWCAKGFDFIGAPQFSDNGSHWLKKSIGRNSGFSLRNVQTAAETLRRIQRVLKWRKLWYRSRIQSVIPFEQTIIERIFKIRFSSKFKGLWGAIHYNEDAFWSRYVAATFPDFKVACFEESLKFSFERLPSYLYSLNNEQLPFGCHAWFKHDREFWKKYIE